MQSVFYTWAKRWGTDRKPVTGTRMPFRIFVLLLLCMPAPLFGRQEQPSILTPIDIEHDPGPDPNQGAIKLDVSVTDRTGNFVAGLGPQDFTLEDNSQSTKIVSVRAFDGVAARAAFTQVILVIDELNSPQAGAGTTKGQTPEQEAETFLRLHQGHLGLPVSVYRLTRDGVTASTTESFDGNALAAKIASRKEPHVIWKTVTTSGNLAQAAAAGNMGWNFTHSLTALGVIALQQRLRPGRKLLFWVGPGWQITRIKSTGILGFFSELSTRLREARIELWCTAEAGRDSPALGDGFNSSELLKGKNADADEFPFLTLQSVARHAGGGTLATGGDLADLIDKMSKNGDMFYALTFDPARTNVVDDYHDLEVKVKDAGLTARTRTGYFDQPVFYDQLAAGTERLSVAQLELMLSTSGHFSEDDLARRLSAMELTERLNSVKLAAWKDRVKGEKARESFVALADGSVFKPFTGGGDSIDQPSRPGHPARDTRENGRLCKKDDFQAAEFLCSPHNG